MLVTGRIKMFIVRSVSCRCRVIPLGRCKASPSVVPTMISLKCPINSVFFSMLSPLIVVFVCHNFSERKSF